MSYDAFLSYSHGADRDLASQIRDALQRLAKPWNRRRALSVFLDQSSLGLATELGESLLERIDDARWLIVLLSEEAARSRWVGEEVALWAQRKSKDQIALVLTSGTIVWDDGARDFDLAGSTAVPAQMLGVFAGQRTEPLYLDLRWIRTSGFEEPLGLDHLRFRDAMATLAAPIHGVAKDELEGEDLRQHRRARRLRRSAVAGLVLLTLAASAAGVVAQIQRVAAIRERDTAEARRLAAFSEADAVARTDLAQLLAVESLARFDTAEGWAALYRSLSQRVMARAMAGHGNGVQAVAFSRDGRRLLSVGDDGTLRQWDAATGEPLDLPLTLSEEPLTGLVAIGSGSSWAVAGSNGTVYIWDGDSAVATLSTGHAGPLHGIVAGADGNRFAMIGSDWSVTVWTWPDLVVRATMPHDGDVLHAGLSADGRRAVTVDEWGGIWEWPVQEDTAARLVHAGRGGAVAAATDDKAARVAVSYDDDIDLVDLVTGDIVHLSDTGRVVTAAFSPDGRHLATGDTSGVIRLWNVQTGIPLETPLVGHSAAVLAVAFHPVDDALGPMRLASGGFDGDARLWELREPSVGGVVLDAGSPVTAVAARDGWVAAAGREGTITILPPEGSSVVLTYPHGIDVLAFGPGAAVLALGDVQGGVRLWDVEATEWVAGRIDTHGADVLALAFDPAGTHVASGGIDSLVRVWSTSSGRPVGAPAEIDGWVSDLAFSPDGTLLAASSREGPVFVWGMPAMTLRHRLRGHSEGALSVAFHDSGTHLATTGADGIVRMWDLETGSLSGEPLVRPEGVDWFDRVELGPGALVLAAAASDGAVSTWDIMGGSRFADMPAHRGTVLAFAFDGDVLLTGGEDGTVRRWPPRREWPDLACRQSGRGFMSGEWERVGTPDSTPRSRCSRRRRSRGLVSIQSSVTRKISPRDESTTQYSFFWTAATHEFVPESPGTGLKVSPAPDRV